MKCSWYRELTDRDRLGAASDRQIFDIYTLISAFSRTRILSLSLEAEFHT
jgi:hypothetical protein